jgi:DNA-binding MarR family transcriptional regulator
MASGRKRAAAGGAKQPSAPNAGAPLPSLTGDLRETAPPHDPMLVDNPIRDAWRIAFVANRYIFPFYRALEAEHGVNRPEWVVLFCLAQRGELIAQDIADGTGLPKNSLSRAVNRLEDWGFVARRSDSGDRRRAKLTLTEDGRAFHDAVLPALADRMDRMFDCLSAEERETLSALMLRVAENVRDWR